MSERDEVAEFNSDLRVLNDLKCQISRAYTNFKKSPKERLTEAYITTRLESLEEIVVELKQKHQSILSNFDEDVLGDYTQKEVFQSAYETYLDYKVELKTALSKFEIKLRPPHTESQKSSDKDCGVLRLPKITLPKFSGNYSEWSSFRDLFKSLVHDNPKLDDVQRLHYLRTQVSGEAEQLIRYVPITEANYKKCWDALQNRYNNKRLMSNCILKRLFGQKNMNQESSTALKELLDTTSDCLHELSNLGINTTDWDVIIIYITSLKLDDETRKQWELQVSQTCENLPTFKQFKDFLQARFRALEVCEPVKQLKSKQSQHSSPKVLLNTSNTTSCPLCSEEHRLHQCQQFSKEDVAKRRELVTSLGVCFNCLGSNHSSKICRSSTKCLICRRKHHTLLHPQSRDSVHTATISGESPDSDDENAVPESSSATKETTQTISTHFMTGNVCHQTLLATALLKAESKVGQTQILRALIDQGSQASFISEASVQLLQLPKIVAKSTICGLGGGKSGLTSKHVVKVNIQSLYDPDFCLEVRAHVIGNVTSILPERKFSITNWEEIHQVDLADPQYNTPNKIDMLLGAEVYCDIMKVGLLKSPASNTIAQNTYLGWILSGRVGGESPQNQACHNLVLNLIVDIDQDDMLKRFWELESETLFPKQRTLTPEEQACEDHFQATTCRDEKGRYIVELPFRSSDPLCKYGHSRNIAVKRLRSLEKRLSKDPEAKEQYKQVLDEYVSLGHMEKISEETEKEKADKVWLPHHAVIRMERTTTKTRVVFNASSKGTNGVSLNDTLMIGPTLQPDLRHIVLKFRLYPICLTADIVKMYRQVRVSPKHVDFQRIVWRKDADVEMEDYRLLTVTFGTACAPYLAVKALQQTAVDEGKHYPLTAERVKSDFYMDDLMTGCHSETEARQIYQEMNEMLQRGGFPMQKWACNKAGILEDTGKETGKDVEIKVDDITKILGLTWNRRTDVFNYTVKMLSNDIPETKRKIIAEISRLYDPLGWIAPCIVTAKVFIQKLWIAGFDWDDKLPDDLLKEWKQYREELSNLVNFFIPRWLNTNKKDVKVELHGFSDASNAAYAAVIYMRIIDAHGNIHTNLVTAKTKVAPIKQLSTPRLELCGAVLVAKLLAEVAKVLGVDSRDLHAWTDSTIVLAWLCANPSRWKTFVANRTSEILSLMDSKQWCYVKSKDNPADYASRGISASALPDNQLWLNGPKWLSYPDILYCKPASICTKIDMEERTIKAHATATEHKDLDLFSRFSTLQRLIRVVSYCRRFLRLKVSREARPSLTTYLSSSEMKDALICCIRQYQHREYADEFKSLLKNKCVSKKSSLITLCPFINSDGVLTVGGRVDNSVLPVKSRHPILIPAGSHFARLIVADAHVKTLHGGQQLMINYIRTRYWIPRLKNLVKSHVHECVQCIRHSSAVTTQLMGQLPACRVTPAKPFLNSGVDYAGPINMRVSKGRGQRTYKGYICLFVCMATRAVHLEAVSDLTSEGFLAAYKRFVARRGRCAELWSDNGTNFVGASRELCRMFADESSSMVREVAAVLANNGTSWRFIPPRAPHFGGLWEAGIKSTKNHLKRVIGDSTLTFEEMVTVLSQIEACLNSRPLAEASSDPTDPEPLTPGHFLVGEPLVVAPDYNFEVPNVGTLRRWHLTQRMVQSFWRRWSKEYLTQFFQRYKWNLRQPEPQQGDVVLVKEENLPPAKWLFGLVEQVHAAAGRDNLIRVVTLRCKGSLIRRPISKLCILRIRQNP